MLPQGRVLFVVAVAKVAVILVCTMSAGRKSVSISLNVGHIVRLIVGLAAVLFAVVVVELIELGRLASGVLVRFPFVENFAAWAILCRTTFASKRVFSRLPMRRMLGLPCS